MDKWLTEAEWDALFSQHDALCLKVIRAPWKDCTCGAEASGSAVVRPPVPDSDEQIESVLRLPVADGEDVAFYLLHGCEGVSPEVEAIMVREVVRTILAAQPALRDEQKAANLVRLQSCVVHGLPHPCEECATEWSEQQDRNAGAASSLFVEVPDYLNALACIDLVDRLLEEGGYTEDSSARHNLAIGRSLISSASPQPPQVQAVPTGFVMVPIEPTKARE